MTRIGTILAKILNSSMEISWFPGTSINTYYFVLCFKDTCILRERELSGVNY